MDGFDAVACYDGPHALAVADGFAPGRVSDRPHMPGMDGDELARRLRARAGGRAVALVAVTARGDDEARRRTAAGGFRLHCVKPWTRTTCSAWWDSSAVVAADARALGAAG